MRPVIGTQSDPDLGQEIIEKKKLTRKYAKPKEEQKKLRKRTHKHPERSKIQVIGKHKSLNFRDERIKPRHQVLGLENGLRIS